jgi:MoaA/NifB/PqqE/SkfB family radical SAM enzyme
MPSRQVTKEIFQFAGTFIRKQSHRLATLELTRFCNRRCAYCAVPNLYASEEELTLEESLQIVDWLVSCGYRVLTCLGGEPLADAMTKEKLPICEYTRSIVEYATRHGMFVNVTSNGDYATTAKIQALAEAGLKSISFSLHSPTREALSHLVRLSLDGAYHRVVPTVSLTLTRTAAQWIPSVAAHVASRGILVSVNICQDHGSEFSTSRPDLVPSKREQEQVLGALLALKPSGLIRTNRRYLRDAPAYYRNNWRCDHRSDPFIYIGVGGKLGVCCERRTHVSALSAPDLQSREWRALKQTLVNECHNCLHQCYFEIQNPDPIGDLSTFLCGLLIIRGHQEWVQRWARVSIPRLQARRMGFNWQLKLP